MGLFHFMPAVHILMAGGFVWIYQRGKEDRPSLQQGVRYGVAIVVRAPIPTYMIDYSVQQMPGALTHNPIIGDSLAVILQGTIAAIISRNTVVD